jgi:hypothetical protein
MNRNMPIEKRNVMMQGYMQMYIKIFHDTEQRNIELR